MGRLGFPPHADRVWMQPQDSHKMQNNSVQQCLALRTRPAAILDPSSLANVFKQHYVRNEDLKPRHFLMTSLWHVWPSLDFLRQENVLTSKLVIVSETTLIDLTFCENNWSSISMSATGQWVNCQFWINLVQPLSIEMTMKASQWISTAGGKILYSSLWYKHQNGFNVNHVTKGSFQHPLKTSTFYWYIKTLNLRNVTFS